MPSQLTLAHIEAERRLQVLVKRGVGNIWTGLGSYDEKDVEPFLSRAVPLVLAGQRQSVHLTDAYLGRSLGRRPLGVNPTKVIGAPIRNGTSPEEVYRRPFVTTWTALKSGKQWQDAVNAGMSRAQGMAAFDVQAAMRDTAQEVGRADPAIKGWQRVADGNACEFCQAVDGATCLSDDLIMDLHNNCNCGLDPLGEEPPVTPLPEGVTVEQHGEMGGLLVSPDDHFTKL